MGDHFIVVGQRVERVHPGTTLEIGEEVAVGLPPEEEGEVDEESMVEVEGEDGMTDLRRSRVSRIGMEGVCEDPLRWGIPMVVVVGEEIFTGEEEEGGRIVRAETIPTAGVEGVGVEVVPNFPLGVVAIPIEEIMMTTMDIAVRVEEVGEIMVLMLVVRIRNSINPLVEELKKVGVRLEEWEVKGQLR